MLPPTVCGEWRGDFVSLLFWGWEEERVSSPSILRLIFQGRFLHGNVTLGGKRHAMRVKHSLVTWLPVFHFIFWLDFFCLFVFLSIIYSRRWIKNWLLAENWTFIKCKEPIFTYCTISWIALKLPPGRTTVMHLVARETLPEPNSHGKSRTVLLADPLHTSKACLNVRVPSLCQTLWLFILNSIFIYTSDLLGNFLRWWAAQSWLVSMSEMRSILVQTTHLDLLV